MLLAEYDYIISIITSFPLLRLSEFERLSIKYFYELKPEACFKPVYSWKELDRGLQILVEFEQAKNCPRLLIIAPKFSEGMDVIFNKNTIGFASKIEREIVSFSGCFIVSILFYEGEEISSAFSL